MASSNLDCIENYEVQKQIGRGGFGSVYKAKSLSNNQKVAIKLIDKKRIQGHPGMIKSVLGEINIHSQLNHSSILKVYSFFDDSDYIYLVLELCPFGDLNSLLKRNQNGLPEAEVRNYMNQIVEGILYLQNRNIMHRDLTLSNMLLSMEHTVKIADFGLATKLESIEEKHFTICGTPNFMAPEVVNQEAHGMERDVWSVGCMLFAMLTGKPPFDADRIMDTFDRVKLGEYDMPESLSSEARDLIGCLLKQKPEDRLKLQGIFSHPFFFKNASAVSPNDEHEISVDSGRGTIIENGSNKTTGPHDAFNYEHSSLGNYFTHPVTSSPGLDYFRKYPVDYKNNVKVDQESPDSNNSLLTSKQAFNSYVSTTFPETTSASSSHFTSPKPFYFPLENNDNGAVLSSINLKNEIKVLNTERNLHPNKLNEIDVYKSDRSPSIPCREVYSNQNILNLEMLNGSHTNKKTEMKKSCENLTGLQDRQRSFQPLNSRSHSVGNVSHNHSSPGHQKCLTAVDININDESFSHSSRKPNLSENFTTARLRPMRQKTKEAVITICEDGCVFAEFFRFKNNKEVLKKIMKISPCGKEVFLNKPKGSMETSFSTYHLPLIHENCNRFRSDSLPENWKKNFDYVSRFINWIRSKTPKITLYTPKAKCMLMENLPFPNFEVDFYSGCKFCIMSEGTKIYQPDGVEMMLNSEIGFTHLSPEMQKMWKHTQEAYQLCKKHEILVSSSNAGSYIPCFPLTIGRKNYFHNLMSPTSNASSCSTHSSEPSTNKSKLTSSLSDNNSQISTHRIYQGAFNNTENVQSPQPTPENLEVILQPTISNTANNNELSSISSATGQQLGSFQNISQALKQVNGSVQVRKQFEIPGVLMAYELSSGMIFVKHSDGSEILADTQSFEITFPDKSKKRLKFKNDNRASPHILKKLEDLLHVISKLEESDYLSNGQQLDG